MFGKEPSLRFNQPVSYRGGAFDGTEKGPLDGTERGPLEGTGCTVQLSVFQRTFFGKGAPRWYNEISQKISMLRCLVKIFS